MTDIIMTSRGTPFTSRAYAEKNLPEGYIAVERDGGWVGIKNTTIDVSVGNSGIEECSDDQKVIIPFDVICPGCGQSYHETTEAYDPDRDANSAMIQLKEKYRAWGWDELPSDPGSGYGILVCPDCGAALAPSGKLRVA